jgi:hypothetical protein
MGSELAMTHESGWQGMPDRLRDRDMGRSAFDSFGERAPSLTSNAIAGLMKHEAAGTAGD